MKKKIPKRRKDMGDIKTHAGTVNQTLKEKSVMGRLTGEMEKLTDDIHRLHDERNEFKEELANCTQMRKEQVKEFLSDFRDDLEGARACFRKV